MSIKKTYPLFVLLILSLAFPLQAKTQKPNVVFIFLDDMGWGDPACYGHKYIKTPNIDRLAKEGKLFTNFYVNASVCSPSRASVYTSKYPGSMGIHGHFSKTEENKKRLMPDFLDTSLPTMPSIFKANGYATGHFGKWHLGGPWQEDAPTPGEYGNDDFRTHVSTGAQFSGDDYVISPGINQDTKSSEWITNESIRFIKANKDKPFLLNAWYMVPHTVLAPTKKMMEAYKDFRAFGPHADGYEKMGIKGFTTPEQVYYSCVTDLDYHIGRLLDKLDELNLTENTIIVFSSDNGPEGPTDLVMARHSAAGSAGVFRGVKRSLYEGGIRVPFIVKWKGKITPNTVDKETVFSGIDLLPSLMTMTQIKKKVKNFAPHGEDLSACLLTDVPQKRSTPLFWEYRFIVLGKAYHKAPQLAIREGDFKLLMNPDDSRIELYNVKKDPGERDNVASENEEVVKDLKKKLLAWHKTIPNHDKPIQKYAGSTATRYDILLK